MATKAKEKSAAEQNVESLKAKYDKLAAGVAETAPNTPERHKAMEAKKAAFAEYHAADSAFQKAGRAAEDADVKQAAAEAATQDAQDAKKHAQQVAKHPERAVATAPQPTPRPVGKET